MRVADMVLSRRAFLLAAVAGLMASCSKSDQDAVTGAIEESATAPAWLPPLIGDPEAASRIGRVYLDAHPEYRSSDVLAAEIEQRLIKHDATLTDLHDTRRVTAAMHDLVRAEYIQNDVVSVGGWILSSTEARLYALTF